MTSPIVIIESFISQFTKLRDPKILEQMKTYVYALQTLPPSNATPNKDEFRVASMLLFKI